MWLATQIKPGFRERAGRLAPMVFAERVDERSAELTVRVSPPQAPAFVQRFSLSRDAGGRWWIDRIEQEGVERRNLADAFVAAPSEALRRRLAEALGVPAD